MNNLIKNKKGDISSILISLIAVFFICIVLVLIFSNGFGRVLDEFQKMDAFSNNTQNTISVVENNMNPMLDYAIFFSFVAITLGLIISSIFINSTGALIMVFIILLSISVVLAGIFANVVNELGANADLAVTYAALPLTKILMSNFPLLVLATGGIVTIILYGKAKYGSQGAEV